jgi:hypothetical protein
VKLAHHAASVLPAASPWAKAMRRELDYIEDDRAALHWALGCVVASYKARLAARAEAGLCRLRRLSSERNWRHLIALWRLSSERNRQHPISLSGWRTGEVLRHAAASGALMLVIGLALLENAGGQTAPPASFPPFVNETACDIADKAPEAANLGRPLRSMPIPAPGAGRAASTGEAPCADPNEPVRILPKYDTP